MPLRTDAYYRAIAADAIRSVGCEEPPVPLEDIIASLGIPVRLVNLPAFFTGSLVYEDGLPVMLVNWASPEAQRRAALAHMTGHVLLVMAGDGNTFPRDRQDHGEADLIAHELVLPTQMVIDQARLWFNDHRYLARLFGVGEDVMMERMREMGLMKGPEGLLWDY